MTSDINFVLHIIYFNFINIRVAITEDNLASKWISLPMNDKIVYVIYIHLQYITLSEVKANICIY